MMSKFLITAVIISLAAPSFAAENSAEDEMRSLTSSVLAGITGNAPAAEAETGETALSALVQQALKEGQSDAYLEALVDEAAASGQIKVPSAMLDTQGQVDSKVLLASLVEKSLSNETQNETIAALASEAKGEAAPSKPVYHVVVSGESLAGIAVEYYDSALAYSRIFDANRKILKTADRIYVGQRLLIP